MVAAMCVVAAAGVVLGGCRRKEVPPPPVGWRAQRAEALLVDWKTPPSVQFVALVWVFARTLRNCVPVNDRQGAPFAEPDAVQMGRRVEDACVA